MSVYESTFGNLRLPDEPTFRQVKACTLTVFTIRGNTGAEIYFSSHLRKSFCLCRSARIRDRFRGKLHLNMASEENSNVPQYSQDTQTKDEQEQMVNHLIL